MCDQDHFEKDRLEFESRGLVTRRQFGVMLGAGVAMMLPQVKNPVKVTESEVTIKTPDGTADAYFVHPATGTAPGVLIWPDIFGLRPAFRHMGKRLAESGYSVLVVNPFYRTKKAPTADAGAATPIERVRPLAQTLNERTHMTDAKAFIAWLDRQAPVAKNRKMGTQGYCMGGPIAFRTAAAVPERKPVDANSYEVGKWLGAVPRTWAGDAATEYLTDIRETDTIYAREGLGHPGLLPRVMNRVLVDNAVLGPWIHVGTRMQLLSAAGIGDELTARAKVTGNYDKKGHRFVELDALAVANGKTPLAHCQHIAIYQPREQAA